MPLRRRGGSWGSRGACLLLRSPARKVSLPLIRLISRALNYQDINFARDLAVGVPVVGAIPRAKAPKGRAREGLATLEHWKA